jgi:hypothetical protein
VCRDEKSKYWADHLAHLRGVHYGHCAHVGFLPRVLKRSETDRAARVREGVQCGDAAMSDLIRPYGFLRFRYWERNDKIPEAIISPEDILSAKSILPSDVVFGASEVETSTIRLRNEQVLVLYHLPLPELTEMIDEAMRERSNMRMPSQPTKNVKPKKPKKPT